jgi:hypothetical protein
MEASMYVLSNAAYERMERNGWQYKSAVWVLKPGAEYKSCESVKEGIERLSKEYEQVKAYESTTAVKGYHDYFFMVKGWKGGTT